MEKVLPFPTEDRKGVAGLKIRTAVAADMERIVALYHHLFQAMEALQPDVMRDVEQDPSFIRDTIESEKGDILLAEVEGEVAGFALVRQEHTPPYPCMVPHEFCFLLDLSVAPKARGTGVGSALLSAVKRWATERGLDYVELNVLSNNAGAKRLYAREGFVCKQETLRFSVK